MKKGFVVFKKMNGIYGVLLAGYVMLIVFLTSLGEENYLPGVLEPVIYIGIFLVVGHIVPKVSNWRFLRRAEPLSAKEKRKVYVLLFGVAFLYLLLWYAGCYPGSFGADNIDQYGQALQNEYVDWHPVIHTLMVYKIPMLLSGNREGSIVFVQMVVFALVLAYTGLAMWCYCKQKIVIIIAYAYILFSPVTGVLVMYPLKDTMMAVLLLLCVGYGIHIFCTSGEWLESWQHQAVLVLALAIATLCRHNAVLFTLPFLMAVFLFDIRKRNKCRMAVLFLCVLFSIKVPLYDVLGVESPGKRQGELLGLPMTIIGNVVVENPEALDAEAKEFVYAIATQEEWELYYETGSWNHIKFQDIDTSSVNNEEIGKILRITLKCMAAAPYEALEAACKVTGMVWSVGGELEYVLLPSITQNQYGIEEQGNGLIALLLKMYIAICYFSPLKYLFYYVGVVQLVLLLIALSKYTIRDCKRMMLCIPLFIYNFGTMLLLSGYDFRFFCYGFMIAPLLIFILLIDDKNMRQ